MTSTKRAPSFIKRIILTLLIITAQNHHPTIAFTPQHSYSAITKSTSSHHGRTISKETKLRYEPGNDPPNNTNKAAKDALNAGFWHALSHTEQWISETLKEATMSGKSNPYGRKELNYVCEMNDSILAAVAGIFRRFREAREIGERHSYAEEDMVRKDPTHEKAELRQTQVVIVPFCGYFADFQSFDKTIQAINLARKNANDFITDVSIERMKFKEEEWGVHISGACLHPSYGEQTAKDIMEQMEKEDKDGEIDLNKIEQLNRRNHARRSPYPTLIIEVQASNPDADVTEFPTPGPYNNVPMSDLDDDLSKRGVLEEIVRKLELIFAQSAAIDAHKGMLLDEKEKNAEIKKEEGVKKSNEEDFFNRIGNIDGVEEVMMANPITATQQWVIQNDPLYNQQISSFTSTDASHPDTAYEFVFSNLAMHRYTPGGETKNDINSRSYLILPRFVSSSATSLEKFVSNVNMIFQSIDGLTQKASISFMHPEHVDENKRSPVAVVILEWIKG